MLFSSKLVGKFGCRAMIVTGVVFICLSLPILATASSMPLIVISLLFFGAGVGLTDVTVNIQGALVEQHSNKPLMSGFHGLFSLGGIVGSSCGSLFLTVGISPFVTTLWADSVVLAIILLTGQHLLPFAFNEQDDKSPFRLNSALVLMAVMCMVCFLAEGSILDWSGIWLTSERGLDIENAGWGYAAFGFSMAIMRLLGDYIVKELGRKKLLMLSGFFAMCGFALAIFVPGWVASLVGFILVGIGAANVAPVLTTLAGLEKTMPPNKSVAFVSTVGYLGILAGPAILGFIAQLSSLSGAFLFICALMLLILIGGTKLHFE